MPSALGDVDGEGTVDLLITSGWSGVSGHHSGRVFIISSGAKTRQDLKLHGAPLLPAYREAQVEANRGRRPARHPAPASCPADTWCGATID